MVLLSSSSDEGGVEDETVLWSFTLGFESSEKSFLGTEDLDGGGWVLGEVGETTSVRDEFRTNNVSNEGRQVGSDSVHSLSEILGESLSEVDKIDASFRKSFDLKAIGL